MANNKERQAYNYFLSIGYAPHESAGIVGNLIAESAMNTSAYGDDKIVEGGSHGLAQWNGPRIKRLKEMYGKDWTKFENQLAFIDWELKNTHKNAYKALKGSKDIAGATHAITTKYEIPADMENKAKQRTKYSQGVFDKYKGDSNIADQRGTSYHPSLDLVGATPTPNFNTESIFDDGILDMILEEEEAEDLIAMEEEEDLYEKEMEEDNEESIAEVEEQADTEQEVEEEEETRDYIQEALNIRAQQVAMIEDMFTYGEEEEEDEYFLQEGGSVGTNLERHRKLNKVRKDEYDRIKNSNPVKKAYNEMKDSQDSDPNWVTRTIRKVATSPLHVASYAHDLLDTDNTRDMLQGSEKRNSNIDGASAILDVATLPFLAIASEGPKQLTKKQIQSRAIALTKREGASQMAQDQIESLAKSARPRFLGGGEIDTKGLNGEEIEDYRISRDTSSELGRLLEIVLKSNRTPNTLGRLNKKKILNNFS